MIEFDKSYLTGYVKDVTLDGDPGARFGAHARETAAFWSAVDPGKAGHRYAPGKWSVRQMLGHVTDSQLIFLYRLICIARGEAAPLPGFDENAYAANAPFDGQPWETLLKNYLLAAQLTASLIGGLAPADWERRGSANGIALTPAHILRAVIGHERHHMRMLRERYGLG